MASRISSIMFISGDLGGQWKRLKSEECSWSHLVQTLDVWVALSCWNCPNPSECTMDMNECRISSRRKLLMLETLRLQEIHPLNLYQVDETFDPYMPQLAHKALAEMWRSIPDALLSQKEMEFTISKYPELSIEELQSTYERIVGP
ncbi:hypothetical protein AVEN_189495-1, partial [Araneus ventricosus]